MQAIYHIKELRWQKGLTMRDLEELSGVSRSEISLLEHGDTDPKVSTLYYLAKALEVEPFDLVTFID